MVTSSGKSRLCAYLMVLPSSSFGSALSISAQRQHASIESPFTDAKHSGTLSLMTNGNARWKWKRWVYCRGEVMDVISNVLRPTWASKDHAGGAMVLRAGQGAHRSLPISLLRTQALGGPVAGGAGHH